METKEIIALAEKEYKEELFRFAVEKYKGKLRTKKSFWDKVFPYKIVLIKKGEKHV